MLLIMNVILNTYDKSAFYLPRHSSFMIMHTLADWGRVWHNRAESLGITTVSTTKAHGRISQNSGRNWKYSLVVTYY